MTRVEVGKVEPMNAEQAEAHVNRCYGLREISDRCAVTIATWFAEPTIGDGQAMLDLSTTGSYDSDALATDIASAYKYAGGRDRIALDMLSTWNLTQARLLEDLAASIEQVER